MQLAAMLDPDSRAPRMRRRTAVQKLAQMRAALALERRWSKAQILEAYLNLVTYRGELQGVGAAARVMFGKAPHGIDRGGGDRAGGAVQRAQCARAALERRAEALRLAMKLAAKSVARSAERGRLSGAH